MVKILLLFILSTLSNDAFAFWWPIGTGEEEGGFTIWIEKGTIKANGSKITLLVMYDYDRSSPNTAPRNKAKSIVMKTEFDCKTEQGRISRAFAFSEGFGKGRQYGEFSTPWSQVPLGSSFRVTYDEVCSKK